MKHQGPFVNLVLQGRVPVPQTPFLGVLGLWYIWESHSEGHRGPKSASKQKSSILIIVALIVRLGGLSRTENWRSSSRIRVLCDPSAPIPPAVSVSAMKDLFSKVLTRKSNENQWISSEIEWFSMVFACSWTGKCFSHEMSPLGTYIPIIYLVYNQI